MSVDRMQKMNHMIKELKKHGFANSSIDAFNKVEKIYDGTAAERNLTMKEKRFEDKKKDQADEEAVEVFLQNFEKFKNNTNQKIDKLSADMSGIISKMNEMIGVIKELEKLKHQRPVAVQQSAPPPAGQSAAKPQEDQQKSHPRSGSLSSGDVDLKKHFYFGNK